MKAMILAAGRGERMRPLTDTTPKPLIDVNGKPLIEYHIEKLVAVGVTDIVINLAWLGDKIKQTLGSGERWGISIHYSDEQSEGALETAGGIIKALPYLLHNDDYFLVINGDVFTTFDYQNIVDTAKKLNREKSHKTADTSTGNDTNKAHLWLIENPAHNLSGDFILSPQGALCNKNSEHKGKSYTFSGIGLYQSTLFKGDNTPDLEKVSALGPILRAGADAGEISAEIIKDYWQDVGTPQRLNELKQYLSHKTL